MSAEPARNPRRASKGEVHARDFSDNELIGAIRDGKSSVAPILYDRLRPAIEHALRRLLKHRRSDIEDLIQVTFERVIRSIALDRFSARSTLTTWAAAIAGHVAIDHLRRSEIERRLFSDAPPQELPATPSGVNSTERSLEARLEILRIQSVLSRMKPVLSETLVLHDVLGHSIGEVSEITRASETAVRSRLRRGRKELVRRTGGQG